MKVTELSILEQELTGEGSRGRCSSPVSDLFFLLILFGIIINIADVFYFVF